MLGHEHVESTKKINETDGDSHATDSILFRVLVSPHQSAYTQISRFNVSYAQSYVRYAKLDDVRVTDHINSPVLGVDPLAWATGEGH